MASASTHKGSRPSKSCVFKPLKPECLQALRPEHTSTISASLACPPPTWSSLNLNSFTASKIFLAKGWTLRGFLASARISMSSSLDRKKNLHEGSQAHLKPYDMSGRQRTNGTWNKTKPQRHECTHSKPGNGCTNPFTSLRAAHCTAKVPKKVMVKGLQVTSAMPKIRVHRHSKMH